MKRWLIILLIFFPIVCSATKIECWLVGPTNEMLKILSDLTYAGFTKQTGIEVRYQILTWNDYYNKCLLALASRETPDIFSLGSEIMDFGLRGGIVDLARFQPKEAKELEKQLFSSLMGPVSFQGTHFGIPYDMGGIVTAYRVDLLKDMGMDIPIEWDDIRKWQPKALAQKKTFGLYYGSFQYASEWGAYTLVTQNGGQFFSKDGFSSALDMPESITGFQEYIELFTKHKLPHAGVGLAPFVSGDWLMITDGTWLYPNLIKSAPQLAGKWSIDLIPGTKGKNGVINHGTFAGGTYLSISSQSKHKNEAWELIKWITSANVQKDFCNAVFSQIEGSMWLPANKTAFNEIKIDNSFRQSFSKQVEQCSPVPSAINVNVLYRYVKFAVDKSILKGIDPKIAIIEAAKEMNQDMSKRRKEYSRFLQELGI